MEFDITQPRAKKFVFSSISEFGCSDAAVNHVVSKRLLADNVETQDRRIIQLSAQAVSFSMTAFVRQQRHCGPQQPLLICLSCTLPDELMPESGFNEELLARLNAGDDHAFVDLFSRYRVRLKQIVEFRMDRRLRGREDASDVLQEVYIDAHQRMAHYLNKPELSFYVWLRQLTIQRLIDIYRRHFGAEIRDVRREVSLAQSVSAPTSAFVAMQLAAQMASPSQVAMRAELIVQIEQTLEGMDELDREVLVLRHFEELRNSEVAEVLGIKEAAASNRYVRALSRLREALEQLPGFFDQ